MNAPQHDLHRHREAADRNTPAPRPESRPEPLWQSALAVLGTIALCIALFVVAHVAGGR